MVQLETCQTGMVVVRSMRGMETTALHYSCAANKWSSQ